MKTLRRGQLCPLHRSYFCCGRKTPFERANAALKLRMKTPDVRIVADVHHPRGYREICSGKELHSRKLKLMCANDLLCLYCEEDLRKVSFAEIELAHKEPKGMGGARRDDSLENLALSHRTCNRENGSKRL